MDIKKTLILTIGTKAQSIVDLLYKNNSDLNFLCLDREQTIINTTKTKTIWYNNLNFQKTEYDFTAYKDILLKRTSKFNSIISGYKNIVVASVIDETFGSDTLIEILGYLNKIKIKHIVFVVKSFDIFESKKSYNCTDITLDKISKMKYESGKNLFVFDCEEVINTTHEKGTSTKSIICNKASKILSMILELN